MNIGPAFKRIFDEYMFLLRNGPKDDGTIETNFQTLYVGRNSFNEELLSAVKTLMQTFKHPLTPSQEIFLESLEQGNFVNRGDFKIRIDHLLEAEMILRSATTKQPSEEDKKRFKYLDVYGFDKVITPLYKILVPFCLDAEVHLNYARLLYDFYSADLRSDGSLEIALGETEIARRLNPNLITEAANLEAKVLFIARKDPIIGNLDNYQLAENILNNLIFERIDNGVTNYLLANHFFSEYREDPSNLGLLDKAEEYVEESLRKEFDDDLDVSEAMLLSGSIQLRYSHLSTHEDGFKRLVRAISDLETSVNLNPENARAHFMLLKAYERMEEYYPEKKREIPENIYQKIYKQKEKFFELDPDGEISEEFDGFGFYGP